MIDSDWYHLLLNSLAIWYYYIISLTLSLVYCLAQVYSLENVELSKIAR